ncbi:SRPBCC domain-containing protein [Pararoseomonas sp. SCSIO 73927]|uniref:SRPBCC domain-containing protein n=1 Tax=Pararoseomonas sp. SCSIO 73927 TaxID=3114537 RepID=UPI0030CC2745
MRPLRAEGRIPLRAVPTAVRAAILDPAVLARIIPGAERVAGDGEGGYTAVLGLGVGPFRGRQAVALRAEDGAGGLAVSGRADGPFGSGTATGRIDLLPEAGGTLLCWRYDGAVRGPVSLAGPLLLRLSATAFTAGVFRALKRLLEERSRPG